MELVAGIVEQARSDYENRNKKRKSKKAAYCPVDFPSQHLLEDCALPLLIDAYTFASQKDVDAHDAAAHILENIRNGI